MRKKDFTAEQLLTRWEIRREVQNIMGKYSQSYCIKQEGALPGFWSSREDVSLGVNDGYYVGPASVRGYYAAIEAETALASRLIRARFPEKLGEKSDEECFGVGQISYRPIDTPVIEVADDLQTAKGIWYCMGSNADVTSGGIASYWTWGYYTADFILEDGSWKFWHLVYENDIETLCGQTWTRENEPYPELESMKAVKDFDFPKPNVPVKLREPYTPRRKFTRTPRLPEPYTTFAETFSYGV